jgi:hypothetical protein
MTVAAFVGLAKFGGRARRRRSRDLGFGFGQDAVESDGEEDLVGEPMRGSPHITGRSTTADLARQRIRSSRNHLTKE